jgi:hypothetical protein
LLAALIFQVFEIAKRSRRIVSSRMRRRNNSCRHEILFRLACRTPETVDGYLAWSNAVGKRRKGIPSMHAVSVVFALALVIASSTVAGPSPSDLPGIGTFAYTGSPIAASLPRAG